MTNSEFYVCARPDIYLPFFSSAIAMATTSQQNPWSFDVASLMVLVSEAEEESYRLSQPSWPQCLATLPVVGLQTYLQSYDFLLHAAKLSYFSPYGVKSAPLRYMRLSNAISNGRWLEDSRFSVFKIPKTHQPAARKYRLLVILWLLLTWIMFSGVLVFTIIGPNTTWIGVTNCTAFTGWSVILRIIERLNIRPAEIDHSKTAGPENPDAIFILGRRNSAFVLEGTRRDIKTWTVRGLQYRKSSLGVPSWAWQTFTRLGSLTMLLFIFSSIPNGSTMDQVAFVVLNSFSQVNTLVGHRLISLYNLSKLELDEEATPENRTDVNGLLCRRYKGVEASRGWIDASGILPQTDVWQAWKLEVLKDDKRDVNVLYDTLESDMRPHPKESYTEDAMDTP